jgi:DNA invertase Pin-like site-specific DNA recombinase
MARTRKTASNPSNFIAYYRVSTVQQGASGLGLEAQRASVERHIANCKGTLLMDYVEVESGKKDDRPQLAAALAHAKREGAVLIIAKLDRLARNVAFIARLMEEATDFVACDMPAANKLTLHIMAAMAEHEREMISARTKAALTEAKKRGVTLGNPRWAESIEKARAARHPSVMHAQVLALIVERHKAGESLRKIASALNTLGLKTPSKSDWHASSVRNVLLQAHKPGPELPLVA